MKIFICDGTPDCFFTAVFYAFKEKDCVITSNSEVQLSLDSEVIRIENDTEKSERVKQGILRYDNEAVNDIMLALRSCDPLREQTALEYIRRLLQFKSPVKKAYNLPEVIDFNEIIYKITGETHRLKGLLRFMESANGAFYAPYSPDNDITELLMPHFAERFKAEKFVIHDLKRKKAGMYNGHEWIMGYAGEAEIYLSEYERAFETLWKKYYKAVNVKERPHERQMKRSMPVRYWKHLPEKNDFE
ncbi:MAG: TIGR03915 family putative DNA repair protein [Clostridia bacterium]|nr:TIGR03915 family putative DNA repair protein [Clostridia bacterium]